MPQQMRAVTQDEFGGPEVLRLTELPRPSPGPAEVLVRVRASGVNPTDWKHRAGGRFHRKDADSAIGQRLPPRGEVSGIVHHEHTAGDGPGGLDLPVGHDLLIAPGSAESPCRLSILSAKGVDRAALRTEQTEAAIERRRQQELEIERLADEMLAGRLPARDRELLILRTGWRCGSEYEWAQHVVVGRAAGLTDDEIARVAVGPDAAGWDPFDALLLRAADELHDDSCLTDATWAALAERYDERQMVEVPVVVGHYHLVSFLLNSLGVPLEDGSERFPA